MLNAYEAGSIDRLYVVFNTFVNTMTQATIRQLAPLHHESVVATPGIISTSRMPQSSLD